ncbi:hypothetical protein [Thalassotalea atypica]|uniref:hypothetical protein n=1 Tax=Thalassotalea atypica TaxID=2054316 RepID=UPI002573B3B3|nr:hypothetical protein [Thalassotalea atypica]
MTVRDEASDVFKYAKEEHALAMHTQFASQQSISQQSAALLSSAAFKSLCVTCSLILDIYGTIEFSQKTDVVKAVACPIKATSIITITIILETAFNI